MKERVVFRFIWMLLVCGLSTAWAAEFVIVNSDSPGVGFNDPTVAAPVGGNTSTTVGAQRLEAVNYAAALWGSQLESDITIRVQASWAALTCGSDTVLGKGWPNEPSRNWVTGTPPPLADVWYHPALANALSGVDQNGAGTVEMFLQLNLSLGTSGTCQDGASWYYGLDGKAGKRVDLVTVVLEELAHGLGFSTYVNLSTGAPYFGSHDPFSLRLEDHSLNKTWNQLTNAQRIASAIDTNDLHWTGSNGNAAAVGATGGVHASGHVQMNAPSTLATSGTILEVGASVEHISSAFTPNTLMEYDYHGVNHNLDLATGMLLDLGWSRRQNADLSLVGSVNQNSPNPGSTVTFTLTLRNGGPGLASGLGVGVQLSEGLSFASSSGAGSYSSGVWRPGNISNGNQAQIQIQATVVETGNLYLIAEVVDTSQGDPDSIPGNGVTTEDDYLRLDLDGIGVLGDDQVVTGLDGESNTWRYYKISLPKGQQSLNISTFGGRGDMDLYLKQGSLPSYSDYDFRPLVLGNSEWVNVEDPAAGDWYIGLAGFSAFSEANLHGNYSDNGLTVNIREISIVTCPVIEVVAEVRLDGEPVSGLKLGAFAVSENEGGPEKILSLAEGEPGAYTFTYRTDIPNGADNYPRVTVTHQSANATVLGVYHNCTPEGGSIDVWADRDLVAWPGASFFAPIHIEPLDIDYHVNSFELEVGYNKDLLTYEEMTKEGSLTEDWDLVFANGNEEGKIYISAASKQQLDIFADVDDILLALKFTMKPDVPLGTCTEIVLRNMIFNNGAPLANLENGLVCVPTLPPAPSADLMVRKTADIIQATPGDTVVFSLSVASEGPDVAEDVTVLDRINSGFSYVSHDGGEYDPVRGVWAVGTLFPDQVQELEITCRVVGTGSLSNTAEVRTSSLYDPDSTPNNGDDEEDDIGIIAITSTTNETADLSLTKTVDRLDPKKGEAVVFTLTVANAGPDACGDIEVTDRFNEIVPSAFSLHTATPSVGFFNMETGVWTVGELAANSSATCTLAMEPLRVGPLTNTAEITHSQFPDPDSSPDNAEGQEDDQSNMEINPQSADLSLTKVASDLTPHVGDEITLTLTVTNDGPYPCTAVTVASNMPPGMSFVSASGDGSYAGNTWTVGALAVGETKTIDVVAEITDFEVMVCSSQVQTSDQFDADSVPGNNSATEDDFDQVEIDPLASDLEVTLSANPVTPALGAPVVLSLSVANKGPDASTGATLSLTLPAGTSYVSDTAGGAYNSGTGILTLGALAVNATYQTTLTVTKDTTGIKTLIVEVETAEMFDPDSTPGNSLNGEDDMASVALGLADLSLALTTSNPNPVLGDTVDLTLTLTNAGPDTPAVVVVKTYYPPDMIYQSHSGSGSYDVTNREWTLTNLGSGSSVSLVMPVKVYGGSAKNPSAEVFESDLGDNDSTPGNGQNVEDDWAFTTVTPECASVATITLVNADSPGEGFNDTTPVSPIGGNSGTTLGAQRQIAFQYALDLWASSLTSNVDLLVEARFDPLMCNSVSGILGQAAPKQVARDFPGAPVGDTFYPIGLANSLAGTDLDPTAADIRATFNSSLNGVSGCLANRPFYYGLDQDAQTDFDFVAVALHELAHGLGFLTFTDGSSGRRFMGKNDAYSLYLKDGSTGKTWPQMTDSERAASARNTANLLWNGDETAAAATTLTSGVGASGLVEMYAPSAYAAGSSVSHFSTSLAPDNLLEPSYTGPNHDLSLTLALFLDLGWACPRPAPALADLFLEMEADEETPILGDPVGLTLTLTNEGPETATTIVVDVPLPTGLTYASHSGGSYDPQTHAWTIASLASGDEAELVIQTTTMAVTMIEATAEVASVTEADPDSFPGNGSKDEDDDANVFLLPRASANADLSLRVIVDRTAPDVGDTVTYTLTVENHGPDPVAGLAVAAPIPEGMTFASASGTYDDQDGTWTIGNLAEEDQEILTLTATADRSGSLFFVSEVLAVDLPDPDSVPDNGVASEDDYASVRIYGQPTIGECASGVDVVLVSRDGPEEGFNDPTPTTPIGGNGGTTLGQQRRRAFEYAIELFRNILRSQVPVKVDVGFDPLVCTPTSAILGSAAPTYVARDFTGAEHAQTWYPAALANGLHGADLEPNAMDIYATFNPRLDDGTVSATKAAATECTNESEPYQVENRRTKVKYENSPTGLGDDRTFMTDTFVMTVTGAGNSVAVNCKAATIDNQVTLVGAGASALTPNGFYVTLVSIVGSTYTLTVTSVCNRHALSHVEFHFGTGASVTAPTTHTSVPRVVCSTGWNSGCELPTGGGGGTGGGGTGGGGTGGGGTGGGGTGGGTGGGGTGGGGTGGGEPDECLNGVSWYYGFDGQAGSQLDFVTVVLHELLHGMGFFTTVDLNENSPTAGQSLLGLNDVYMKYLEDTSRGLTWDEMIPSERIASAKDVEDLHWVGEFVRSASAGLTSGRDGDLVRMYASNPIAVGSTVTHFSPSLSPDTLLEPAYLGPNQELTLETAVMQDLGWARQGCIDLELDLSVDDTTPSQGQTLVYTLTLTNQGPDQATGVEVITERESGLDHTSDNGAGAYNDTTGIWTVGTLDSGDSVSLEIHTLVGAGGKRHLAEVRTAREADADSIPDNRNPAEDDYDAVVAGNADLDLTCEVNDGTLETGSLFAYTLTLSNSGPDAAEDVRVHVSIPSELTLLASYGGVYQKTASVWVVDSLPSNSAVELQLALRAGSEDSATLTAEISAASTPDPDSTPGSGTSEDDECSTAISVNPPDLSGLRMDLLCVMPLSCPTLRVIAEVTAGGDPISGLDQSNFQLTEDGLNQAFTVEEEAPGLYWFTYNSPSPDGNIHHVDLTLTRPATLQGGGRGTNEVVYSYREFTNCDANGCTRLTNGVPATQVSDLETGWRCFSIDIPANQRQLMVDTFLGTGNMDLYMKYGAPPTPTDYGWRSFNLGTRENLTVAFPTGGRYYIGTYAKTETCGVSLLATYSAAQVGCVIEDVFLGSCPEVRMRFSAFRDSQPVAFLTSSDVVLTEDGYPVPFTLETIEPGVYDLVFLTTRADGGTHELAMSLSILGDIIQGGTTYSNCFDECMALENNQVVPDMAGLQRSWRCFCIDVPAGQDFLEFRTWDGRGDTDLYVQRGTQPTTSAYHCRSSAIGAEDTVRIESPQAGRWYVALEGMTDYRESNLQAKYWTVDLACTITEVAPGCPSVVVLVDVFNDDGPVSGLTVPNFSIVENNGTSFAPESVTETTPGSYRVVYNTTIIDGREVFMTLTIQWLSAQASETKEFLSCTPALSLPLDHGGLPGSEGCMPVSTTPISSELNLSSFHLQVTYDPDVISYTGVNLDGSVLDGWDFIDDSQSVPGEVILTVANTSGLVAETAAPAALLYLCFALAEDGEVGECSPVSFVAEGTKFNDDYFPGLSDGMCCITACPGVLGDVDGDGDAQEAFDALQILHHVSEVPTVYDPIPICVGDTNCSGAIGLVDAVEILRASARLIRDYCGGSAKRNKLSFDVAIAPDILTPGDAFEMDIQFTRLPQEPVYGYSFTLTFDPEVVQFTGAVNRTDTLSERWGEPIVNLTANQVIVTGVNPYTPIRELGSIVKLVGFTNPDATTNTEVTFTRFELAEASEPNRSFGPITLEVEGAPCFDQATYQSQLASWNGQGQPTVLDMIRLLNCD